jgi:hypothetical protein
MYECEQRDCAQYAGVWAFQGNLGQAIWHNGAMGVLTVKQFDGRHIVIDRVDPPDSSASKSLVGNGGSLRVEYTGTITGDHVEGTAVWDKVPGLPYPWSATIPATLCATAQDCPLSSDQLVDLGGNAYDAKEYDAAYNCFKAATGQGNADGAGYLAFLIYSAKNSSAQEEASAFLLAQDSAKANSWVGMVVLGKMYYGGVGTKPDPVLAKYWFDKGQSLKTQQELASNQQPQGAGQLTYWQQMWLDAFPIGGDSADAAYKRCWENARLPSQYSHCSDVYKPKTSGPFD